MKMTSFWDEVGKSFPSLYSAPSTSYYFECEKGLFERSFPPLAGKKVFKTDLWDEAKNSQILRWAAEQGAQVYGADISVNIAQEARALFERERLKLRFVASDLREIPFAEESFDLLYSMGTIEHFPEYFQAVSECFRILRRKGLAIIGVPNRYDPFLRPLMVTALFKLGLYSYGYEKSFSMSQLERTLEKAGFQILERTGILFMPGWLRMADLYLHVNRPGLTVLTSPFVSFFRFLYRKFPWLRPHGYLIACVVKKP
jgi:SAM-dependent methyltransferase